MSKTTKIVIGVVVAVLVAVTAGPFVYIHFIESKAPAPLALSTGTPTPVAATVAPAGTTVAGATTVDGALTSTAAAAGTGDPSTFSADGTWAPNASSIVGYRVKEKLFGQSAEAAGRTSKVTGSMTIAGTTVSKASFTADMTTVKCDQSGRDDQFQGRIMQTSKYPTATFELTSPIELATIPADKTPLTVKATGILTLHGTTKAVTIDIGAQRNGTTIEVNGSVPIVFADYGVGNPSGGPATTEDHGVLEFLIVFAKG